MDKFQPKESSEKISLNLIFQGDGKNQSILLAPSHAIKAAKKVGLLSRNTASGGN